MVIAIRCVFVEIRPDILGLNQAFGRNRTGDDIEDTGSGSGQGIHCTHHQATGETYDRVGLVSGIDNVFRNFAYAGKEIAETAVKFMRYIVNILIGLTDWHVTVDGQNRNQKQILVFESW